MIKWIVLLSLGSPAHLAMAAPQKQPIPSPLTGYFLYAREASQSLSDDGQHLLFSGGSTLGNIIASTAEQLCRTSGFPVLRSKASLRDGTIPQGYDAIVCSQSTNSSLAETDPETLPVQHLGSAKVVRYSPRLLTSLFEQDFSKNPTNLFGYYATTASSEPFALKQTLCPQKNFVTKTAYVASYVSDSNTEFPTQMVQVAQTPSAAQFNYVRIDQTLRDISCSDSTDILDGTISRLGRGATVITNPRLKNIPHPIRPDLETGFAIGIINLSTLCPQKDLRSWSSLIDETRTASFLENQVQGLQKDRNTGDLILSEQHLIGNRSNKRALDGVFCLNLPANFKKEDVTPHFYESASVKKIDDRQNKYEIVIQQPRYFGFALGSAKVPRTEDNACELYVPMVLQTQLPNLQWQWVRVFLTEGKMQTVSSQTAAINVAGPIYRELVAKQFVGQTVQSIKCLAEIEK